MARFYEPSQEELAAYTEWTASLPQRVRVIAEHFEPWSLYRLKTTTHRVFIISFGEPENDTDPVTLTICVSGEFNEVMFERNVFGILPESLEPCELPTSNETTGALFSSTDVEQMLPSLRAASAAKMN